MNIEEARQQKRLIEANLAKALEEFSETTGCVVNYVAIDDHVRLENPGRKYTVRIDALLQ